MKSLAVKTMMALAVVAGMAGVAPAQNLKVDIPFSFTAGGSVMPPGEYRIYRDVASTSGMLRLVSNETDRVVAALPVSPRQTSALDASNLYFKCGEGPCELVRIATPYWAADFGTRGHAKGSAPLASIRLTR